MKGGVRKTEDGERYTARGKGRRVIDHNTRVCDEALSARVGGEGKSLTLSRMEGIAHTRVHVRWSAQRRQSSREKRSLHYSCTLTARSDTAKNRNIKRAALYELRTDGGGGGGGGGGGRRGGRSGRLGLWAARSMDSASAFSIDSEDLNLDSESSRAAEFCSSATSLEIQCFHRPQLEDTVRRVSRATHRRISADFATSCAAACRASAAHRPQQRETACRESRTKHRRTSADFAVSCAAA